MTAPIPAEGMAAGSAFITDEQLIRAADPRVSLFRTAMDARHLVNREFDGQPPVDPSRLTLYRWDHESHVEFYYRIADARPDGTTDTQLNERTTQ